ncbi:TetR/AcrR family transcriptional regulator [Nocardioides sp. zg-1228]|uniref:TetR/AcrR family transcriptional regulator n=1 Tax=Nocardioides sp. zg-1228 TaxID=2763008 RepID=UPI00164312FB|nr:TetR/AcrR family transcriptional regulator [Nocardioides sp. zg-1228]MBC2934510.1 TetR/AcrR family transcriptional regulator [Nocardioides sp. zg-1228]QSF59268.1 TetR/AcrR family transcriptional regulator [Nocardioides sp. zg-1228]
MATAKTPAVEWIAAGLRALASGGPDAVRVERLAAELGVTKGGFYWHFADRRDFLDKLLDAWETTVVEEVISHIETHGGAARERLSGLFEVAVLLADVDGGLRAEPAIRDWARRDPAVAERLRRIDGRRMDFMRSLFLQFCPEPLDAEARCLQAYSLLIGSYFLRPDHGDLAHTQVLERAFEHLLR